MKDGISGGIRPHDETDESSSKESSDGVERDDDSPVARLQNAEKQLRLARNALEDGETWTRLAVNELFEDTKVLRYRLETVEPEKIDR